MAINFTVTVFSSVLTTSVWFVFEYLTETLILSTGAFGWSLQITEQLKLSPETFRAPFVAPLDTAQVITLELAVVRGKRPIIDCGEVAIGCEARGRIETIRSAAKTTDAYGLTSRNGQLCDTHQKEDNIFHFLYF